MIVPPETLIDGMLRTLEEEVLPDVATPFARGQLHAVLDVLANLRNRVEEKAALFRAESEAAVAALEGAAAALREAGREADAEALAAARAAAPGAPPGERAAALRAAVADALERVAALPEAAAGPAHEALRGYLVSQAVRDVLPLQRSRLGEIAKG